MKIREFTIVESKIKWIDIENPNQNDLTDFCPLLELVPKKDYKDLMKNYGESQILNNISAIQHIATIDENEIKNKK